MPLLVSGSMCRRGSLGCPRAAKGPCLGSNIPREKALKGIYKSMFGMSRRANWGRGFGLLMMKLLSDFCSVLNLAQVIAFTSILLVSLSLFFVYSIDYIFIKLIYNRNIIRENEPFNAIIITVNPRILRFILQFFIKRLSCMGSLRGNNLSFSLNCISSSQN